MDHGDGNMQRWKRAATREELCLALVGMMERINHEAKEGIEICVRLSSKEGYQGRSSLGTHCFIQIMEAITRLDDLVREMELAEERRIP